jgi:hypothetical protein
MPDIAMRRMGTSSAMAMKAIMLPMNSSSAAPASAS